MTELRILGLTGCAGAGKDTLALGLRRRRITEDGPRFLIYSMTSPINRMIDALQGKRVPTDPFEQPAHWSSQEWKASTILRDVVVRELQQKIGTEFGRMVVHEDIWLWLAQDAFATIAETKDVMVITNVRFENEARWVRSHGKVVEVIRPEEGRPAVLTPQQKTHSSEAGFPRTLIDHTIENNSTPEDLAYRGEGLLRFLGFHF